MSANSPSELQTLVDSVVDECPSLDRASLSRYLGDIVAWNDRIGLVSKRSTLTSLRRLVLQSAQLLDFLGERGVLPADGRLTVVDIGTGAGFPGVVWKLMEPRLRVTLIERKQKKATFLERTRVALGLEGVEVSQGDAEELGTHTRLAGRFDVAVTFAVGGPRDVARVVEPFLKPAGWYCTVRPLGEQVQPRNIGTSLVLEFAVDKDYGRCSLYRRRADAPGR
jgi:16S rRNA (guanine527-N7)-methyltransferase